MGSALEHKRGVALFWGVLGAVVLGVMVVPDTRRRVMSEVRDLFNGPGAAEMPEPEVRLPGPFPGEQMPPQGPYIEVQMLDLVRSPEGELKAWFLLTTRSGLAPVDFYYPPVSLTWAKLWTEDGRPVGFKMLAMLEGIRTPLKFTVDPTGTETEDWSPSRWDLLSGDFLEPVASGPLRYIIDCVAQHGPAEDGQYVDVRLWGQGLVDFTRQ